jgi:hypothetical protein
VPPYANPSGKGPPPQEVADDLSFIVTCRNVLVSMTPREYTQYYPRCIPEGLPYFSLAAQRSMTECCSGDLMASHLFRDHRLSWLFEKTRGGDRPLAAQTPVAAAE